MVENHTSIATENAQRLAALSTLFCRKNGITITPDLASVLSNAVLEGIANWYSKRGRTFDPKNERIENDALVKAFARAQIIAYIASFYAMTEIGTKM